MSAEVVNLRRFRKAKNRADKTQQAERNRVTFGRGKAERRDAEANRDLAARRLDAARRTAVIDAEENSR